MFIKRIKKINKLILMQYNKKPQKLLIFLRRKANIKLSFHFISPTGKKRQ